MSKDRKPARGNLAFIAQVQLGPRTIARYRGEAEDAGCSLDDYVKRLVEGNWHLIFGEEMTE